MTKKVDKVEARQGVTGHKVRYVLAASLVLAVVAFVVVAAALN